MEELLGSQRFRSALSAGFIKPVDLDLIPLVKKRFDPDIKPPTQESAFFYPSAGTDLITPLIIALPYCRQFYYYDHDLAKPRLHSAQRKVFNYICHIKGLTTTQPFWINKGNSKILDFDYYGKRKILHWVGDDNLKFLSKTDINLAFYFHRGDSYGEGGSRQFWDSTLLSDLRNMISPGGACYFITDGEPGGPAGELQYNHVIIKDNASHVKYYIGQIGHAADLNRWLPRWPA